MFLVESAFVKLYSAHALTSTWPARMRTPLEQGHWRWASCILFSLEQKLSLMEGIMCISRLTSPRTGGGRRDCGSQVWYIVTAYSEYCTCVFYSCIFASHAAILIHMTILLWRSNICTLCALTSLAWPLHKVNLLQTSKCSPQKATNPRCQGITCKHSTTNSCTPNNHSHKQAAPPGATHRLKPVRPDSPPDTLGPPDMQANNMT